METYAKYTRNLMNGASNDTRLGLVWWPWLNARLFLLARFVFFFYFDVIRFGDSKRANVIRRPVFESALIMVATLYIPCQLRLNI